MEAICDNIGMFNIQVVWSKCFMFNSIIPQIFQKILHLLQHATWMMEGEMSYQLE